MPPSVAVVAHGVGGRQDLPLPFPLALAGALLAIAASFAVLALLWRSPRLRGRDAGRPLPRRLAAVVDSPATAWVLRILGLLVAAWIAVAALLGPDDALNPTAGFVYVVLWVGLCVVASALIGPVLRALNPLRTIHLLVCAVIGRDPDRAWRSIPTTWGRWPAALLLTAFLWLELAAPDRASTRVLIVAFAIHAVVVLGGAAVAGRAWFAQADPFEAYSTMVADVAPFGRRRDGALVVRTPSDGVEAAQRGPGLAAVTVVLLGGTLFDGLSNAPAWVRSVQSGPLRLEVAATLGLLASIGAVAAVYALCVVLAARLGGDGTPRAAARAFAPSLIPIVVGYAVAHYYSLLVIVGQQTVQAMSDPLGRGDDLIGVAEHGISYAWVQPTTVAVLQVVVVVVGHILGAVAAHERAVRTYPRGRAVRAQVPLLGAMLLLTLAGLSLLFAG
jgi:hypothetical protein